MNYKFLASVVMFVGLNSLALAGGAGHIGGASYSPDLEHSLSSQDAGAGDNLESSFLPVTKFLGRFHGEYVFKILEPNGESRIFSLRSEELDGSILNAILESERNSGKVVELTGI